jgi:uroporphyrinogen III methyltransferase/synthase
MSLDGVRFVSIGPVTSATMRESGLRVDAEAREYTMPGVVRAVVKLNL